MQDISTLCRACLKMGGHASIFSKIDDMLLSERFKECIDIDVKCEHGSVLPSSLCKECITRLIESHNFRVLCLNSQTKLLSRIENNSESKCADDWVHESVLEIESGQSSHLQPKDTHEEKIENIQSKSTVESGICLQVESISSKKDQSIQDVYLSDNFEFVYKRKQGKKKRLSRYMCEVCGYRANDVYSLNIHTRYHTGEKPHQCHLCEKRFTVRATLTAHLGRHGSSKALVYVCEVCGERFSSGARLRRHQLSALHGAESAGRDAKQDGDKADIGRSHRCPHCPRSFVQPSNLRVHCRTHSGDKPHKCQTCGKCFTTSSDLKGHSRSHSGERPYECDQCHKRFSLSSNLAAHLRIHGGIRNHLCHDCGKTFGAKASLKSHMRVHSAKDTSHVCSVCGVGFVHAVTLSTHMSVHRQSAQQKCQHCHKLFLRSSSLKAHIKKNHKCDIECGPLRGNPNGGKNIKSDSTSESVADNESKRTGVTSDGSPVEMHKVFDKQRTQEESSKLFFNGSFPSLEANNLPKEFRKNSDDPSAQCPNTSALAKNIDTERKKVITARAISTTSCLNSAAALKINVSAVVTDKEHNVKSAASDATSNALFQAVVRTDQHAVRSHVDSQQINTCSSPSQLRPIASTFAALTTTAAPIQTLIFPVGSSLPRLHVLGYANQGVTVPTQSHINYNKGLPP